MTRLIATDFAPEDTSPARAGLNEPKATVTTRVSDVPEPIVLELGASTDDASELYLRRRGNATIYLISTYLGDRLQPDAKAFERSATPPAPPAVPPQGQGTPQLPPEVMRQLQERIREQQQQQR